MLRKACKYKLCVFAPLRLEFKYLTFAFLEPMKEIFHFSSKDALTLLLCCSYVALIPNERKIKRGKKGKQKQKKVTFLAILKNISYFCTQGSLIY